MHLFDHVTRILLSNESDLRALAELVAADPTQFYRFQDLSNCDLRGQDLSGMDLTGTNVERSRYDQSTIFDPKFDPRTAPINEYVLVQISNDLNVMILAFAEEKGYTYIAWAYKYLIQRGLKVRTRGHWSFYENLVRDNPYLLELVSVKRKVMTLKAKVQIYKDQQDLMDHSFSDFPSDEVPAWIILVGMLAYRIRHNSRKDYTNLIPSSLFRKAGSREPQNELFTV